MTCFIFHDWSKWVEYSEYSPERRISKNWGFCAATEYRQRRTCKCCGYVEDRLIRSVNVDEQFERMRQAQMASL